MTASDIRVALIGFGYVGRVFHAPLIDATPGLSITVIGSSRGDTVRQVYPHAEIVGDPLAAVQHRDVDLVVLATPNETHTPLAEAALRAGKHVVVDKPFTITLAEARALAATAEETGRLLSVFQNRRWDSDFQGLRRELAAGRIGDVVELRSEFSRWRPEVRDRWRERPGPGAGMWYDLGPHLVDQALVLFGVPDTVFADMQTQRAGGSTVDWFQVILGHGRRRVVLESSMLAADTATRFLVRGTSGALIKRTGDRQEDQLKAQQSPGSAGWGNDPDPWLLIAGDGGACVEIAAPAGAWQEYYAAIGTAVRGSRHPPVTPMQATAVMAVIEAGLESATSGCIVRPRYTDAERSSFEA